MTSHYSEEFTRDKPYSVTVAFISHFNALHQTMKGLLVNDDATFFQCVEELAKTNQVIKRNHQFLDQIRQLRNLLTHHKTEVEVNLAYPSEETNQQLFEINQLLTEIPSTRKFIKPVFAINMDDSLEKALTDLHHHQVSQLPVFNKERLVSVISAELITKFIADEITKNSWFYMDFSKYKVKQIINHSQHKKITRKQIISPETPIFELDDLMVDLMRNNRNEVLLISEKDDVRKPEDIIGIVTQRDITTILNYL